ncbi:MAG: sulfatase-like hydrolase/transferase [Alphaproteobacteria bacterium]|nr:sulfatase-like hydrolase/transferase [Alphaproteobacteria bacterium]
MDRPRNAFKVAGAGASFGFAFLGAEELLNFALQQPPLRWMELLSLVPFYVGIPAVCGLLLGAIGFQGIAAGIWLWATFTAALLVGPLMELFGGWGLPPAIGAVAAPLVTIALTVGLLFLTRSRDSLRWGALTGVWAATTLASVVNLKIGNPLSPIALIMDVGIAVMAVAMTLAISKALDNRQPRAGVMAFLFGVLMWGLRIPASSFGAVPLPAPAAKGDNPSVVVIIASGLRADHLSFMGYRTHPPTTPNIDALAGRSIVYEQAQAAAPASLPAIASMMTGMIPSHHDAGTNEAPDAPLPSAARTLAEYAKGAGYGTYALVTDLTLTERSGLAQGFDFYEYRPGIGHRPVMLSTLDALGVPVLPLRHYLPADRLVDRAVALLGSQRSDSAYLLVVQFSDLLPPYVAPDELVASAGSGLASAYDAELRYLDAELQRLLNAIPKDTWIVMLGDHGVSLGEHPDAYPEVERPPDLRFGDTLYQEQLRVPLIVFRPRNLKPVTVLRAVRAYDVMPTLLEIFNTKVQTSIDAEILTEALGRTHDAPDDEAIVSEAPFVGPKRQAVRKGPWKYIESADGTQELYNLFMDPGESNNLIELEPDMATDLSYELPGRTRPVEQRQEAPDKLREHYEDGETPKLPDGQTPPTDGSKAPADGTPQPR